MKNENQINPNAFSVAVSSTKEDLLELRNIVRNTLVSQRLTPIMMDNDSIKFDGDALDSSYKLVQDSAAYILIIGHKYGTIREAPRNPDGLSYTELEYEKAKSLNLPKHVLIMGDDCPVKREYVEIENIQKLEAFRKKVESENTCTYFNSEREFEGKVKEIAIELRFALYSSPTPPPPPALNEENTEKIPSANYHLIASRTNQEFIEFKFSQILKPILNEVKQLLGVPELSLAFLPQRNGAYVPILFNIDYDNYEAVDERLLGESKDFRESKLSSAVISGQDGNVRFWDDSRNFTDTIPEYLKTICERPRTEWKKWVKTSISDQIGAWLEDRQVQIVCGLKYIFSPDNRDVVGFMAVPEDSANNGHNQSENEATAQKVQSLVEKELLPVLRLLVLELARKNVRETNSRVTILDTILEAAVSLSGADWGCIKSTTLGATSTNEKDKDCELAQAVCVHNCPRFFQEGKLIDTEKLVAFAIEQKEDMVLDLSPTVRKSLKHPASQMAVFLIRDKDRVIEPRKSGSDIVGAIVLQHSAPKYIEQFKDCYSPFIQELAKMTSRMMRAAASKPLASLLKRSETFKSIGSFEEKVDGVVEWVARNFDNTWALLQPINGVLKVTYQSRNKLAGLQDVLLEIIGADQPITEQSRLAAFACNSTMSLMLLRFHYKNVPIELTRIGISQGGANAYFNNDYVEKVAHQKKLGENSVIFNLGNEDVWKEAEGQSQKARSVAIVLGPIVSPVGGPVGVLAVLRETEELGGGWNMDRLKQFEARLLTLRDDVYLSYLALNKEAAKSKSY